MEPLQTFIIIIIMAISITTLKGDDYTTTAIIANDIIPIHTSITPSLYVDQSPTSGHLTIIIGLSTALVFAVSACLYMLISKRKSSVNQEQTDTNEDSRSRNINDEYSEVNLNVNRLNSMNGNITSLSTQVKRTMEGVAVLKESMESMYDDCNNVNLNGNTMHTTKKVSGIVPNKLSNISNTASEGNMRYYFEGDRNSNDDEYGSNQDDWVSQTAPIVSFHIE
eukprot:UN10227